MKDKLKKILCVLTAASVIAALAACGESSSVGSSDSSSASASETVSESETTRQSNSLNEPESTSESESESQSESESGTESEKPMQELKIISPEGVVYPYIDIVKNYLESDKGVEEFYEKVGNAYAPVTIEWKNTYENVRSVKVEYSVSEDMSGAETTELEGYKTKLNLYNLLKGTKYYVRVTGEIASDKAVYAVEIEPAHVGSLVISGIKEQA